MNFGWKRDNITLWSVFSQANSIPNVTVTDNMYRMNTTNFLFFPDNNCNKNCFTYVNKYDNFQLDVSLRHGKDMCVTDEMFPLCPTFNSCWVLFFVLLFETKPNQTKNWSLCKLNRARAYETKRRAHTSKKLSIKNERERKNKNCMKYTASNGADIRVHMSFFVVVVAAAAVVVVVRHMAKAFAHNRPYAYCAHVQHTHNHTTTLQPLSLLHIWAFCF